MPFIAIRRGTVGITSVGKGYVVKHRFEIRAAIKKATDVFSASNDSEKPIQHSIGIKRRRYESDDRD